MADHGVGMQDQACRQMARVDSVTAGSEGWARKSDANERPRPLRERVDGRRCSSSVAGGRHVVGGGVSMEEVVLGAEKSVQLVCFASSETRELENGYCV